MGIRSTINEKPAVGLILALAVVVAAIGLIFWSTRTEQVRTPQTSNVAWFSDDDGQSWFADSRSKSPPFEHNGKQAYRAYVYTCDGGKTKFAAYLERFTAAGKAALDRNRTAARQNEPPQAGVLEHVMMTEMEVKKPGPGEWIRVSDPRATAIRTPTCPDGSRKNLQPVFP